jgi:C1A family cysteine protease
MNFRRTTLGALSLLTLATTVAACGQAPNTAPRGVAQARTGTYMVQGVQRKLGFDAVRYEKVLAKRAKPVRIPRQGLLPTTADNRETCSPVADQGKLGACTAFAMGKGLREYMQRKNGERQEPLSALFQYYETRVRLGSVNEDSGGTITDGMMVLKDKGIATEASWGYDIAKFTIKPPAEAYASAGEFKVKEITQLASLDDVKASLAAGNPVAFGFIVYEKFMKIGADGKMPMPGMFEKRLGGHAVLAVGYDDNAKHLIVRNSWSAKWGDHGYFYMPYDFAKSGKAMDFWTSAK